MTLPFSRLVEKSLAHMMIMGSRPDSLQRTADMVLSHEENSGGATFTIAPLLEALRSDDDNDPVVLALGRAIWTWDNETSGAWTEGTAPHTPARRARIYDRLGFEESVRAECSRKVLIAPASGGPTVIAETHQPWYPPAKLDQFYWKAYTRHLREVNRWPEHSVVSLDESTTKIVERLADPSSPKPYQTKGLVVGYVQSGKTANFTGVIAKAADAGYRLFIVLGGMLDVLREQTQRRIDRELIGQELLTRGDSHDYENDSEWDSFIRHGRLPSDLGAFDWERLTGPDGDFKTLGNHIAALEFERVDRKLPLYDRRNLTNTRARLIVIKKNTARLNQLLSDIKRLRSRRDIPTLIIDDESDQASINTRKPTAQEQKDRTSTNQAITALLRELPRAQYVGYTATPFANVFVDPTDADDIFPKDFVISLDRPADYMGVSDFFDMDLESAPTDGSSNEKAFVRGIRGNDTDPENLRRAIDAFVISGAIKLYRKKRDPSLAFRHHTMLVHRSAFTKAHADDAALVQDMFDNGGYLTGAGFKRLRKLFNEDFLPICSARAEGRAVPANFEALKPHIGECLATITQQKSVRIVNGDNRDDTPNFEKESVWSILVGGTKLSRGYTIEGLTISYYRRASTAADTLMQMGRWFGFRRGYRDLVRLFIGREEPLDKRGKEKLDLYEAFKAICRDEEEFRKELKRYSTMDEPRITPRMIPPLVPSHLLRPTQTNKMYNARIVFQNFSREWCDPTGAPRDKGAAARNAERMRTLLAGAKLKAGKLGGTFEGERAEFEALVAPLAPGSVLSFLESYEWADDHKGTIARQLEFLRGNHGDPQIDHWLFVAPLLVGKGDTWTCNEHKLPVRHRARVAGSGRYKVYTEPQHKKLAAYLATVKDCSEPTSFAKSSRKSRRAVFLFYAVRDADLEAEKHPFVSMGFALLFPENSIRTQIRFSVHDPKNPSAVTVSAGKQVAAGK